MARVLHRGTALSRVALRPLVILGATGSIGAQTLDVAERLALRVHAMAARRASLELLRLAEKHPEALVVVAGEDCEARDAFRRALGRRVRFGAEHLEEIAATPDVTVVNGIVGAAGLAASVAALLAGNRLALANKESLVAAGPVVVDALRVGGGELIPVDSEHSALWQCLVGEDPATVRRLVLTASGGPFLGRSETELGAVTVSDALAHPTWAMGPRITVDSATLMNKAFEVIEAAHLFGMPYDRIDVAIHPQSIVHSMVEFVDGSVKAQLGEPDMRVPIQYAIAYPHRVDVPSASLDLAGRSLTFFPPDRATFRCLDLGYVAGRTGGSAPAVLNAADEIAVAAFLDGRVSFLDIATIVERTLDRIDRRDLRTISDVLAVDAEARTVASAIVDNLG